MEMEESIARATATAGGAVAFAGTTVVIALVLAGVRRHPAGQHDGLHGRGRGGGGGDRRGHAAAGDARRARPADRLAAGAARQDPSRRPRAARLAALGRAAWPSARGASMVAAGLVLVVLAVPALNLHLGQNDVGRAVRGHHGAPGLRPDLRGLRPGPERAAAGRRAAGHPGQARPEEPGRPEQAAAGATAAAAGQQEAGRRGSRTGPGQAEGSSTDQQKQADQKKQLESSGQRHAPADAAAATSPRPRASSRSPSPCWTRRATTAILTAIATTAPSDAQDRGPRERPARHRDPQGGQGHRPRRVPSAARRPATSTWPSGSATSCRR